MLFNPLYRFSVFRAFPVHDILVGEKSFAAVTVISAVASVINVAGVENFLQYALNNLLVAFFSGADEVVVFDSEKFPC